MKNKHPQPKIPQRLRGIAVTILNANDIFWEEPELTIHDVGLDCYKGINPDPDSKIRSTWTKLAEIKLKEVDNTFFAVGVQVTWGLFYERVKHGDTERQSAWFIQISHRHQTQTPVIEFTADVLDTSHVWDEDEHYFPGDNIHH